MGYRKPRDRATGPSASGLPSTHRGGPSTTHLPSRRTVVRSAAWTLPAVAAVTAAPAFATSTDYTDLSTSSAPAPTRSSPTTIEVPATTFINTGTIVSLGISVRIESNIAITKIMAGPIDPAAVGVVISGLGTTLVTMQVPADGLAAATIQPNGGTYTSPLPQTFTFAAEGPVTMSTVVTGVNAEAGRHVPYTSAGATIP